MAGELFALNYEVPFVIDQKLFRPAKAEVFRGGPQGQGKAGTGALARRLNDHCHNGGGSQQAGQS